MAGQPTERAPADMRASLSRVRGLGSAKEGVSHWWAERMSALALVPLTLWFVASIVALAGAGYAETAAWLRSPLNGGMMLLFIGATFYHSALGLQVVIEDYLHREATKLVVLALVRALSWALALAAVLAVMKIMFGS